MGRVRANAPIYGLQVAEGGTGYLSGDGEFLAGPPVGKIYRGAWIAAQEQTIRMAFRDAAKRGLRGRAFGSRARGVRSFELEAGDGKINFINPASWGLKFPRADRIQEEMRELQRTCNGMGINFRPTAASWAMALYRSAFGGDEPDGGIHQLPPVYRPLIIRGYCGGPIVMSKGEATPCRSLDKVRAYARCMEEAVPVGRPIEVAHLSWDHLREHVGMVEATIHVAESLDLPPMPVRLEKDDLVIYPVGTFRGVWTTRELAAMEDRGDGVVLKTHEAVIFDGQPVFAAMMDQLAQWEDQGFKQAKFTANAFTGKWAQHSTEAVYCNYSPAEVRLLHPRGKIYEDEDGIRWVVDPEDLWGKRTPIYRPQISAWIVGNNRASVFDSIRRLEVNSVSYVHIDAIWTSDLTSDPGPGWRQEGVYARSRHYAAGIYAEEGGSMGHAGIEARPTLDQLDRSMKQRKDSYNCSATEQSRAWTASPNVDPSATSVPLSAQELDLPRRAATSLPRVDPWTDHWTEHGYPTPGSPYYSRQWERKPV